MLVNGVLSAVGYGPTLAAKNGGVHSEQAVKLTGQIRRRSWMKRILTRAS